MKREHSWLVRLEKSARPPEKHQSPLVQYTDAGSEEQRLPNVVGDEQRRLPDWVPQMKELLLQFHARHWIQRAKRFVDE